MVEAPSRAAAAASTTEENVSVPRNVKGDASLKRQWYRAIELNSVIESGLLMARLRMALVGEH